MKNIFITLGFVISSQVILSAAPQFNIPGLNIPVTFKIKEEESTTLQKRGWETLAVMARVYNTHKDQGIKNVLAECGKGLVCMQVMHSTSTLCHELAHAVVAKYCIGRPSVTFYCSPGALATGILEGKTETSDPYRPEMSDASTVKEVLSNYIQTRKNTERNQIIYRAAGPIIGAAVSGTLGYLLKDYVSVAPFIGTFSVLDNALNLSPLYGDGRNAVEAWHKLQALREIEKEFHALPEDQEIDLNSDIFQRALKL